MKMEVEKISQVYIKPSSPTPPHLKSYKISLLDQLAAPSLAFPLILYYYNQDINLTSKMSWSLKQSLSETLTHYYPLAGRLKDNLSIDCNDEGVFYINAKANISLSEYLTQPDLQSMSSLSPITNWHVPHATGTNVMLIQETIFACGSITIAVLGSHVAMDGIGLSSFVKYWAEIARNSTKDIIPPNLDGPSIFPQYEAFPEDIMLSFYKPLLRIGNCSTRRFFFNASSIGKLKAETSSSVENPTRVEVVSALLLKCFATILKEKSGIDRPLAVCQAANLRLEITPRVPKISMGNFIFFARGLWSPEEIKIPDLINKHREEVRRLDSVFVRKLQSGGFNQLHESLKEVFAALADSETGVNSVGISSWCNFGLDAVDFGWGKPAWISCISPPISGAPFLNLIVLMDAGIDKGIEAWVVLNEEDLVLLEKHKQLLQYASLNLSPMKLLRKPLNSSL